MNTKLTLSLDRKIIQQAKRYAKTHNISLSFLVENYLLKIISDYETKAIKPVTKHGSVVEELSGIIHLNSDLDYNNKHSAYLMEKYQ